LVFMSTRPSFTRHDVRFAAKTAGILHKNRASL
jgi:hypothetical protein